MINHMVGPYKIVEKIGIGSMASVYKAIHCETNQTFAIKTIMLDGLSIKENKKKIQSVNNEIELMKSLNHQNIIKYIEMFQETNSMHIVMEYANYGSLQNDNLVLPMNYQRAYNIVNQIVDALDYLHNIKNVVHRDLKIDNILLQDDQVKLCDFGFSKKSASLMKTRCGSPAYVAPEIIKGMEYSGKVDIWSLGIILFLLSTGQLPFYDDNINHLFHKICGEKIEFPGFFDSDLKELIEYMLQKDPENRCSLDEIRNCAWMKKMSLEKQGPLCDRRGISLLHGMTKSLNMRIVIPCGLTVPQRQTARHPALAPIEISGNRSEKNGPSMFYKYRKKNYSIYSK